MNETVIIIILASLIFILAIIFIPLLVCMLRD